MRTLPLTAVLAATVSHSPAALATGWQDAPSPIHDILGQPRTPGISISPDNVWLAELERESLPPIARLARPIVKLAGLRIDASTYGPGRSSGYAAVTVRRLQSYDGVRVPAPEGGSIRNVSWAPDSRRLMYTVTTAEGVALWVLETSTGQARALTGPDLNAANGSPCRWLPEGEGMVCKLRPAGQGAPPEADPVPAGPLIEENGGRSAPARTYQDLLQSPHDEALFTHYLTSEVARVALDGTRTPVLEAALWSSVQPSPDGAWLLTSELHTPFSYHVPVGRFPRRITVRRADGTEVMVVDDLPLADDVPVPFGSVRRGRRTVGWRADVPASLYWVAALDDGDAGREAEFRDAVSLLAAPFEGEPQLLWQSELRYGGVTWAKPDVAIAREWWHDTRRSRAWRIDPSNPGADPFLLEDRDYQDAYTDPGSVMLTPGPFGRSVLRLDGELGHFYRAGRGASAEGVYPFLDRVSLATGESERVWHSEDPYFETVVDLLDAEAAQLITRRQSATTPANYVIRRLGRRRPVATLTRLTDPAPQLARLGKQVLRYTRADGVSLSATLYTPPGWSAKDGPLPTLLWVYPSEFKSRDAASRVTASPNTFSRPGGSSVLFLLTQGYAVLANPTLPIIGEGEVEPNDSYVEQLVAGAEAAVAKVVELGVADPERMAIGGHSYGAFTTANLLAHTDLFRAGIARSGAYNRSLTPFGFQGEQRTWWEATDSYLKMSPFTWAHRVNEPLLMIHGAEDSNSGTHPMQSERMYEALKGLGATARWVVLPQRRSAH